MKKIRKDLFSWIGRYLSIWNVFCRKTLREHIKSIHGGKKAEIKCQICGVILCTKQYLAIHIASVHEGIKPFKCEKCTSAFTCKRDLIRHNDVVHDGIRSFKCTWESCEASFGFKRNLQKHISSVHEGKKPYKCDACDSK